MPSPRTTSAFGFTGIQVGGIYNTLRGNTVENGGIGIEEWGGYGVIKGNTVQKRG